MTLVVSVATPAFGLHVSDRLVSKGGAPYDALANKTVVFRASDGLVVFGYTGAAFLGGMPTDSWIADAISDGACANDTGAIRFGGFRVRDTGSTLLGLRRRLERERLFRTLNGAMSAVGWQWNGRRKRTFCRPVLWLLGPETRYRWIQLMPRHPPERRPQFRMRPIGNWPLGNDAWQDLVAGVGRAGPDLETVEAMVVAAIRRASSQAPGSIGSHCMSVVVKPGDARPNARVRFLPVTPHLGRAGDQDVEVAFTPWMVAPDGIHSPALSVGGLSSEQGLLTFEFEAPPVPEDQALKGAFQTYERPTP